VSDDELVDDVLASVVPLGGEPTPQTEQLRQAVLDHLNDRPTILSDDGLAGFSTLALLDELRRRLIQEEP
jgi:hypothetical protein